VFWVITLPLILPAIASAWMLSFILSWDDIVIHELCFGAGVDHPAATGIFEGSLGREPRHQCVGDAARGSRIGLCRDSRCGYDAHRASPRAGRTDSHGSALGHGTDSGH
jgi:hypothetical protein